MCWWVGHLETMPLLTTLISTWYDLTRVWNDVLLTSSRHFFRVKVLLCISFDLNSRSAAFGYYKPASLRHTPHAFVVWRPEINTDIEASVVVVLTSRKPINSLHPFFLQCVYEIKHNSLYNKVKVYVIHHTDGVRRVTCT